MKKCYLSLLCTIFFLLSYGEESRLMRFPHINGNNIVFSYAGDLYTVSSNGGTARKLTSHIGYEMFPRYSPDGKYIAFTGQYDGNTEVFVIPSEGGEPRRLTYTATLKRDDLGDRMGPNNIVIGWTPDSKHILYRSRCRTFNDFTGQLFTISIEGGESQEVPLNNGGFASYSPDGKKLAYNYIFREFRTWKRYEGGMADDIRIFDFETKKSEKITDHIRQNIIPMWSDSGNELYFISDRNNVMNLYVYNINDKSTNQITNFMDYDIKFPAIGNEWIVYEQGGYIHKFNTKTQKSEKIRIDIENDQIYSRPQWKDVSNQIRNVDISPNGERLLITARGDIFSVPTTEGITYNLTNSSNANDFGGKWSPNGKYIAYISDKSGEFHIWIRNMENGQEKQITRDIKTYIFNFTWSPDSKKILWHEKKNTLNITDIENENREIVETSGLRLISSYNWSPDSKYITYVNPGKNVDDIIVYNINTKEKHLITDGWFDCSSPNFSKDGKYLLFVSSRTFNPSYGRTEWNHIYTNMQKVYILPLDKEAPIPFAPKNDKLSSTNTIDDNNSIGKKDSKKEERKENNFLYNFEYIKNRVIELPIIPSSYFGVHMIDKNIYYNRMGQTFIYNIDEKKETELGVNLTFSADYKKALARQRNQFQVINIPSAKVTINKAVNLSGVKKQIDYKQEWMQIYDESWRQMRDFFYAKNMHGVDWEGVYEKYKVLVPYVNHRTDLTYIIGEMIGELNVGHAYSANGEHPLPERIPIGLLGAEFEKDKSGYFKVKKIIEGANWDTSTRSPFTMPGVDVKEGEFILAINGQSVAENENLSTYLIDMAGKTIEIEVNNVPEKKGSRKVLVVPLEDESKLYYYNWVQNNIRKVNEATNGEVGYIHIPDMGVEGLNEFVKHYYPQLSKKALIIDDRGNGGGNVSPMITERLQRTPTFYTMHTNQTEGSVNPAGTFIGPKVLLINEYSASDGDLFPYRFKHNKLGTVVGKRTWGGVVGYSGMIPVVDGGSIVTPSYAPYSVDGQEFIIEGIGVYPDIEIDNDPYKEFMGEDEQLNKAIETILEQLRTQSKQVPSIPEFPDKANK